MDLKKIKIVKIFLLFYQLEEKIFLLEKNLNKVENYLK